MDRAPARNMQNTSGVKWEIPCFCLGLMASFLCKTFGGEMSQLIFLLVHKHRVDVASKMGNPILTRNSREEKPPCVSLR